MQSHPAPPLWGGRGTGSRENPMKKATQVLFVTLLFLVTLEMFWIFTLPLNVLGALVGFAALLAFVILGGKAIRIRRGARWSGRRSPLNMGEVFFIGGPLNGRRMQLPKSMVNYYHQNEEYNRAGPDEFKHAGPMRVRVSYRGEELE